MALTIPMIGMPQGAEWLWILAIFILLFGAAKLPDLARGTGRALRIFKAETKGLNDDDSEDAKDTGSSADDHRSGERRGLTSGEHVTPSQPADDPAKRAHDS